MRCLVLLFGWLCSHCWLCAPVLAFEGPSSADLQRFASRPLPGTDEPSLTTGARSEQALTARARLATGQFLFVSRSLSLDGQAACADCHRMSARGPVGDGLSRPRLRGKVLARPRTPALFDVGWKETPFFWNGRARTLEQAIFWPLFGHDEMDADPAHLERQMQALRQSHSVAFADARFFLTEVKDLKRAASDAVVEAIAGWLRSQRSGRSRWDEFLDGQESALTPLEKAGLRRFVKSGCAGCHAGRELDSPSKVPVAFSNLAPDHFSTGEAIYSADQSLHDGVKAVVTLDTVVPSLRNLAQRGPPFGRFGQFARLEEFLGQHCSSVGGACAWAEQKTDALMAFLNQAIESRRE